MSQFQRGTIPGQGILHESISTQVQFSGLNGELNANVIQGVIDSTSVDSGNSPTTTLRGGIVMGKVTSTGEYKPYSASATDGSQNAVAVLLESIDMLDGYGVAEDKLTGRLVKSGNLVKWSVIGLTPAAEQQLIANGILFDEAPMVMASSLLAHNGIAYDAADKTLVAADSGKLRIVSKAGAYTATLPAIANSEGLEFAFVQTVDQNMAINSAEGENVLALNNATADGVIFSTGSQKIGAMCIVKCIRTDASTLKWIAKAEVGTMTVVDA